MFTQKEDTVKKVDFITLEVFNHLRVHCSCGFAQSMMITGGVFSCFETGSVHFRAYVHGTANATAAAIIQRIQRWVNGGAVLTVNLLQLRVDNTCTVAIPSITYNNDGCESLIVSPDEPTRTSPLGLTEILVTLILSVSIVLLITVIVVVAFLALKKLSHTRIERGSVSTM